MIELLQLDGKLPNLALMRLSAHWKRRGEEVHFRRAMSHASVQPGLYGAADKIYASMIFERTRHIGEELVRNYPHAIIGGTGWSLDQTLEKIGIHDQELDYSIYPNFKHSIGFTQRGCRLKCEFCVVPRKEGRVAEAQEIMNIWRGDPWPKNLVLLDNDFFGSPQWRSKIAAIRDGGFRVSFNQGINARCITEEAAEAIASVQYYDDDFKTRRIYTAWDNRKDEERLFDGLKRLVKYGVKPDQIMVYMLIGFWPGETHEDRDYRRKRLRDFGCRPFPMPFRKTPELMGFQRWVVRREDFKCPWEKFMKANFRPEKVRIGEPDEPLFNADTLFNVIQ